MSSETSYGPTIREVARDTGLAEKTIRKYCHRHILGWVRDPRGMIRCQSDAAEVAVAHYRAHGAPGGRAIVL